MKKTPLKRTKGVNPVSKRRRLEGRTYSELRLEFLAAHPVCQVPRIMAAAGHQGSWEPRNCDGYATDVHHMKGRIGPALLDQSTWLATCRRDHDWIEAHPREAKEVGLAMNRVRLP